MVGGVDRATGYHLGQGWLAEERCGWAASVVLEVLRQLPSQVALINFQ
jgi:hypothetical protein